MTSFTKSQRARFRLSLLAMLVFPGFSSGILNGESAKNDVARKSRMELDQISEAWLNAIFEAGSSRRAAKSPEELERVERDLSAKADGFIKRCLDLSNSQPDSAVGLAALKLVACRAPEAVPGAQAAQALSMRVASVNLDALAEGLGYSTNVSERPLRGMAPVILERVKQSPDHPQAPMLLARFVCGLSISGDEESHAPAEFAAAADLIVKRFAESPDIVNFCEQLGMGSGSPIWAADFERHLRTIIDRSQHRNIRVAASFALASVIQGADESRQTEAEKLYEAFLNEFDGSKEYSYVEIEKMFIGYAKTALVELRLRGLGKPVPEIIGADLDGHDMKISEFRGRVVLLNFWATWCSPCMRMVPHERELAKRFEGKSVVLLGVNGDDNPEAAKRAAVKHQMTWRSFRKKQGQKVRSIPDEWSAVFPSYYLIDQAGIIRKRWLNSPPLEELNRAVEKLLDGRPEKLTTN